MAPVFIYNEQNFAYCFVFNMLMPFRKSVIIIVPLISYYEFTALCSALEDGHWQKVYYPDTVK